MAASPLEASEACCQVMVVCLVPLKGEEEVPIQAEGGLVVAVEVGKCQMVIFQDPVVVAAEEATLVVFLEVPGVVLRA